LCEGWRVCQSNTESVNHKDTKVHENLGTANARLRNCSNLVGRIVIDPMDRIAALNEILTENPKDAFARYGLAMEYSKQGDFDRALAEFSILLENHPEYTAGYFMAAQTLVRAERVDDAKKMLNDGIASARRTGNLHAQSEMEAMLGELG